MPGWPDALSALGQLYPNQAAGDARADGAAVAHFREAAQAGSRSGQVWEMLGELLAGSDPAGAHSSGSVNPCKSTVSWSFGSRGTSN